MKSETSERVLMVDKRFRVLAIALVLNGIVAFSKIVVGIATGLLMITADGVHSLGDAASNVIGMVSLHYARRSPDEKYPYGYAKFETIAAFGVGFLLLFAVREILERMYARFIDSHAVGIGGWIFVVMAATLIINMWVVRYETKRGKELASDFLLIDAAETKSDIFISLVVLAGLGIMKLGFWFVDVALAALIVVFILRSFWQNLKKTFHVLADAAVVPELEIMRVAESVPGVQFCHAARSRGRPDAFFIDAHIGVFHNTSVEEAHDIISHRVKLALQKHFDKDKVQCVTIHIEPDHEAARTRRQSVFKEGDY